MSLPKPGISTSSIMSDDKKSIAEKMTAAEKASLTDKDDLALEQLVAPSKLQRNFNLWSLAFMSFCSTVTWEAISSTMAQAFITGGSSSLVWGFVASAVGALLTVLCIGEYASMIPTSGGQYHYVSAMAAPRFRRILSWYTGWITILGWILCALAGIFSAAMQIQSWAILFSPEYTYERWHTCMIVIGMTTVFTVFAIFDIKHLHHLLFLGMALHTAGYFATAIYLLVHVKEKNSAEFVFTDDTNLSGWQSPGIAWLIGLLTTAVGFSSWDSPLHMAEEMHDVARDLPRSLLINIVSTAVATFPWIIAVAFCITDVAGVLSGPVGTISFMAQLYYNVSGGSQAVTVGLTMWLPVMAFCGVGPSIITATSRVVWAFARDGGLPEPFARVSDRTKTPIISLLATWASVSILTLVYIGNDTAFYGMTSACTVALYMSFGMPLLMNVIWGFQHTHMPRAVFSLGKYHRLVAVVACAWCGLLTVMICFPIYQPVTSANMNYAGAVVGAGLLLATVSWFAYGRTRYIGLAIALDGEVVR